MPEAYSSLYAVSFADRDQVRMSIYTLHTIEHENISGTGTTTIVAPGDIPNGKILVLKSFTWIPYYTTQVGSFRLEDSDGTVILRGGIGLYQGPTTLPASPENVIALPLGKGLVLRNTYGASGGSYVDYYFEYQFADPTP